MDTGKNHYPEFEYPAGQLSAFSYSVGTFVISLKSGVIIQFTPKDTEEFKAWLDLHRVRDISVDIGIPEPERGVLSKSKTKGK